MPFRNLVALLAFAGGVAAVGCRAASEAEPPRSAATPDAALTDRVGWVHGSCLAIANPMLSAGSPLAVVAPDGTSPVVDGRVTDATQSDADCPPLREERRAANAQAGWSFYRIRAVSQMLPDLGIAVVGELTRIGERLDLTGDGAPEAFTQCSTAEGIRFAVWSGTPYDGTPVWTAYYYLGYDTHVTCP